MIALFLSSFLAATFFPAQSELGLVYLVTTYPEDLVALIAVASVGNTLGSVVNWAIGLGLIRFAGPAEHSGKASKWYVKAQHWYERYGYWSLLISWAPLVGDPVTLVAGVFREPLWRFFLLVAIAKTVRYIVVAAIALQFT
ncbi:YqaA family protein [Roseibium alexandrii]|jgi:membrane protein YqaA with SNARE-associated domain|uniref:Putative membrane protein n=1 Tax=Roseibium alexandrii (strain DSM 17067 / NCIMB 14079 / DFL-11) TaxID=244592 RepID=A0A5E8H3W8_ROSAD|nr:YqaA family protein [Roseibium alexandrii]EEE46559.1 putative membrane protein [Roseibium alexandrii DFL-11]